MLPPVVALPSSQISYQDQRPSQDAAHGAQLNAAVGQMAVSSGLEQSAAVAGRLNILLLSGRERMAENLAMIAQIFGATVGISRKPGESSASFAARLAEAIASLPAEQRARLEAQLMQALKGAQLRMLLAAFRDPAGPDAAKLSLLIELARAKEGDRAARTVVTSYRQNGEELASEKPPVAAEPTTPVAAAADAGEPGAAPTDGKVEPEGSPAQAAIEPADGSTAEGAAAEDASAMPGETGLVEVAAGEGDGSAAALQPPLPAETKPETEAEAEPPQTARLKLESADARGLQSALAEAFSANGADGSGEAAGATVKAMAAPAAPALPSEEGDAVFDRIRNALTGLGELQPKVTAASASNAAAQAAAQVVAPDQSPTLLALRGWREVDNIYPALGPDRAAARSQLREPGIMADALAAVHADGRPTEHAEERVAPAGRLDYAAAAMAMAENGEHAEMAAAQSRSGRSFPETLLSQMQLLGEQAATQRGPVQQTAPTPPFALATYLSASDDDDFGEVRRDEERRREDAQSGGGQTRGEQGQGEQRQGEGQAGRDDAEERQDAPDDVVFSVPAENAGVEDDREPGLSGLAPTAHLTQSPESERANNLYWRMAGWS